jgi:hypothetical protein
MKLRTLVKVPALLVLLAVPANAEELSITVASVEPTKAPTPAPPPTFTEREYIDARIATLERAREQARAQLIAIEGGIAELNEMRRRTDEEGAE